MNVAATRAGTPPYLQPIRRTGAERHYLARRPVDLREVTVLVPTLNEAENLPHVLGRIPRACEVLIVDGGSIDGTPAIAERLRPDCRVIAQRGSGKGGALLDGALAAERRIVVTLDADGSTRPEEIARFVGALHGGARLAKGSRFVTGGASDDLTAWRELGNRALCLAVNRLFAMRLSDLCYGYNAFWRRDAELLLEGADGFDVETLMTVRAARHGLPVVEVPSHELRRLHGASNLHPVRDGLRILGLILRERLAEDPAPGREPGVVRPSPAAHEVGA